MFGADGFYVGLLRGLFELSDCLDLTSDFTQKLLRLTVQHFSNQLKSNYDCHGGEVVQV